MAARRQSKGTYMAEGKTPKHANAAEWEAALQDERREDGKQDSADVPVPTLVDSDLERFYRRTTIGIVGG